MARLKIVHIAPTNISGVPGELVRAEREMGHDSRLVTLFRDRRRYFEDICLELPFIDFSGTRWIKKWVSAPQRQRVDNRLRVPEHIPLYWRPHSGLERLLVQVRDHVWQKKINRAIAAHRLDQYDVYQLDGGLDLTRQPRFMPAMKAAGRVIICCYTGSDLRTRGVIPEIDAICDTVVSVEFDHRQLHPRLHHVFFPFDSRRLQPRRQPSSRTCLRIGHAPTSRAAKGSDEIIPVLEALSREKGAQIALIEGMSYDAAIALKGSCDLFVDQIGDLGYGINSLEALAMGIPALTCLAPGFAEAYPDHPFVVVDANNLQPQIERLLVDAELREQLGRSGREWIAQHHDARAVVEKIHQLAGIA